MKIIYAINSIKVLLISSCYSTSPLSNSTSVHCDILPAYCYKWKQICEKQRNKLNFVICIHTCRTPTIPEMGKLYCWQVFLFLYMKWSCACRQLRTQGKKYPFLLSHSPALPMGSEVMQSTNLYPDVPEESHMTVFCSKDKEQSIFYPSYFLTLRGHKEDRKLQTLGRKQW